MFSHLLYRAFGFRQYQCVRTTTEDGVILFHLEQDAKHDRCSHCQSPDVIRHGAEERTIRTVPIGSQSVAFRLPVPRLGCRNCGLVRQAAIAFAKPHRRFSHAFERYALKPLSYMTIQAVADHLQVGWDSIKDLFKRYLKIHFAEPKLKKLKRLAIDETTASMAGWGKHPSQAVLYRCTKDAHEVCARLIGLAVQEKPRREFKVHVQPNGRRRR